MPRLFGQVAYRRFCADLLIVLIIVVSFTSIVKIGYSPPPWWNLDWNFRKSLTIDHTKVVSDLTDFPVLLDIVDSNLKVKARSDGGDIVFIADSGATLNHEIESYGASTGHLVAWIKIPLLSSSADTIMYMYYGNPNSANQQNPNGVWGPGFLMVQHLQETSTARRDSTISGNNGTAYGGISKVQRIDGADYFDGVNDYISVPDASSLNPQAAITIEMWMNLSLTGNFINLASKGAYNQYYLRLGPEAGRSYWYVKFADGTVASIDYSKVGWIPNALHHMAATLSTQDQTMKLYLDGVEKLSGTFPSGRSIASSSYALQVSDSSSRQVKGIIDEIRVSGIARSPGWIRTGFNNQVNPTAFCFVGLEEPSPSAGPLLVFGSPPDETTELNTNPRLSVRVLDLNGNNMTVIIKERTPSGWVELARYNNAPDGTYFANATSMKNLATTYYWGAYVDDGTASIDTTFTLTTTAKVLKQKWTVSTAYPGVSGVLAADINNDGVDEVLYAGKGGVLALDGSNGAVIWNITDSSIGDHAQPQMADLDKDGVLEIVVPLETPAGLLVLHANNSSTYWRLQNGLGKETYSGPVIFDIGGNGYPTIFMGSTDTSKGLNGTGRVTSLSYDGRILYQTFAWRPCSGGLSIADTDSDGVFEIYMGERNMYLNTPEYGDSDYGKGVLSLWAENLSLRWYRPEIFCSSQKPMIADVNNDGILDIIIGDLTGGLAVLNATDGSTIRMSLGISQVAPTHYQPSICDIDGDGNLEMLMADPHDSASSDLVVWDLVKWQVDARIYIGKNFYGPQVADVTGDGVMDIIACNYKSIFIIDKNYRVIDGIVGLSGDISTGNETKNIDGISMLAGTLNYAVTQDIDGDGYSEVVVTTQSGTLYAFDTPARRLNPRPRSEVQFYSEYRRGVAEYVQPQGGQTPVISSPLPSDLADSVPVSTSQLSLTLTDYQQDLMNYTVTTTPNIGSITKTNNCNGRYSMNISGLTYSTTYAWTVTATDGTHSTNKTYSFTTQSISPWWDRNWQYRKQVTIDHTKVAGDQSDFPVLVDMFDSDLPSKARSDGADIVFTDINSNRLAQQNELYDNSTGHLITWTKVPQLSSSVDTTLYMYYGNPNASSSQNVSAVWDSNFVMVQHLADNSTMRYDSTQNGNNGTTYGNIAKMSGKIAGADNYDGIDDYLQIGNSPSLNPSSAITIELWMNLSTTGNFINLVNKGIINQQYYNQYYLRAGSSAGNLYWFVKFSDQSVATIEGSTGWTTNTWNYVVAQVDTQTSIIKVYVNGIAKLSASFASGKNLSSTLNPLLISDIGQRRIKGIIDEIRVSNVSRSPTWILTSYNNEKNPATFYKVLGEETIPESRPVVSAEYPADKSTAVSPSLSQLSFNLTCYENNMNYTVTTSPNIGSAADTNVSSGRFSANVSGLQYFTAYTWSVNVTDGIHWTDRTFTFYTLPSEPPTQGTPQLIENAPGLVCTNQSTNDADKDKVTNIYHWYKNGVSTTNLLLPFDTNSSLTVKDYSGYGNDGILVRGATWTTGKIGGAYNFNRGFIQIPGSDTLDGGGQWSEITLEEWIYLSSSQSGTRTLARIPSYEIGIKGNTIYASIWTATGNPATSGFNQIVYNVTLQNNVWYHVAVTYKKGVAFTLYLNGSAVASKTPSDSATLNYNIQPGGSNPLYIGWFDYFKGMIDDVRIYPRALSAQQINQRYIETKDGSSNSSTMVAQETVNGETWRCEVAPNDGRQDGTTKSSNAITVGSNDAPIISSYYPLNTSLLLHQSASQNETQSFNITCFDPDMDTLAVEWWVNSTIVKSEVGVNYSAYVFDSTNYAEGVYIIRAIVKDNWSQTTQQWTAQVQWSNDAPIISSYYPLNTSLLLHQSASQNDTQSFNVTCFDPDGDVLSVEWWVNSTIVKSEVGVNYSAYVFDSTNYAEGVYIIRAIVKDNWSQTTQQWTLQIQWL